MPQLLGRPSTRRGREAEPIDRQVDRGTGVKRKGAGRLIGIGSALLLALVAARLTGLTEHVSLDGQQLEGLDRQPRDGGSRGFIVIYVGATVAFLPATPLTLLSGLVFGAVWGTLWAVIGATIGATLAFLIGRYAARGLVESWTAGNERVRKLDEDVEKHGWRMLVITRLVPLFPFNLQNYAYGLTRIGVGAYVALLRTRTGPIGR
jgi:uncharacterized membrane protein YdjX (TVP38/TMEM64 family)